MKRVLIVEDDPTWAMLVGKYVTQLGWESLASGSPQDAINKLDAHEIDIIVLDMLLAAETGMALLNEMQAYNDLSKIPIVVLTNSPGVNIGDLAKYGVDAVLDKSSVGPEDIKLKLKELACG